MGPETFCIGFPLGLFASLRIQSLRVLRDTTYFEIQMSQQPLHFCRRFPFFFGNGRSCSAFVRLFVSLMMREQTLIPCFTSQFVFERINIREMPTLKAISCKNLSNSICTVVEEWIPGLLLPLILLFLDTLRPRVIDRSEECGGIWCRFCARSLLSCQKLHWSPFEHWPFSFHW